jgi:hypothetical protein
MTLVCLIVSIAAVKKFVYVYDPKYVEKGEIHKEYEGLGGWLILPGLGLLFTPVRMLVGFSESTYVFSENQWSLISDQFAGSGFALLVATELAISLCLLVMSVCLIILFFQKRHTLPKLFIAFFLVHMIFYWGDLMVISLFFSEIGQIEGQDIKEGIRLTAHLAIWGIYFTVSKRVKATFIKQKSSKSQAHLQAGEVDQAPA